jgi:hypothetical protein
VEVPLKEGCRLELPPDVGCCEQGICSRYMYRCYTPPADKVWHPQVHRSCAHNAVRGLQLRTLGLNPGPTPEGELLFSKSAALLKSVLRSRVEPFEKWTHEQVVSSYKVSRLRTRYEEARLSLLVDGLSTRRDADVSAFVKAEKLGSYKLHKPRVIMGRSPRYNLELASYLKPLEHVVYPAFRGWSDMYTRTRLIGKGLNGEERASLLRRKMLSHPGMVCFEVDCKSFESHLVTAMLQEEHGIYASLLKSPRLRELLSWQLEFPGRFRSGVSFRAKGVRASGDFNTGLGNTLIMCCLVLGVASSLRTKFDFLADGDNAVVFVASEHLHLWRRELPNLFLSMGHEAEIGETSSEVSGIVFGQSKPLCVNGRWTMIRDPDKVLSSAFSGHQHYNEMRGGMRVLKSVAYCEAVLNRGVPVLQAFAHAMLTRLKHVSFVREGFDLGNYEYQRVVSMSDGWRQTNYEQISLDARLLFEKSWGYSVEEQLRLEASFLVGHIPERWDDVPPSSAFSGIVDPWGLPLDKAGAECLSRYVDQL